MLFCFDRNFQFSRFKQKNSINIYNNFCNSRKTGAFIMDNIKAMSQLNLGTIIQDLVRFECANAYETEGKELDKYIVKNSIQYIWKNSHLGDFFLYFNPQNQNQICGSLYISFEDQNSWWIQSAYISQNHRRKGIFSILFNYIVEKAKSEGVCKIKLCVRKDNARAKSAYARVGMQQARYHFYEIQQAPDEQQIDKQMNLNFSVSDLYSIQQVLQNRDSIQKQQFVQILGQATDNKKALICKFEGQTVGYCQYYQDYCDWKGGVIANISCLYLKQENGNLILNQFIEYIEKIVINLKAIRFVAKEIQLNYLQKVNDDQIANIGYDIMEISI